MIRYLSNLWRQLHNWNRWLLDISEIPIFRFYLYFNNWYNYKNILEYVPDLNVKIKDKKITTIFTDENKLVDSIKLICNKLNNKKLIISLSGGVDSMVLTTILHNIGYEIICVHINYNNRKETKEEEKFLTEWCKFNKIKLYVKSINEIKRENTKRSEYELITKNLRLDFYKEIMKKEDVDYVLLAHHKDDIIENIFANICRGRNYLDLAVIREHTIINNINIIRPMINHYKNIIYDFAHLYQIPYFKDTTPHWSVRGKYRNIIAPALDDAFTKNVKDNLLYISNQADEWNTLTNNKIIKPFIEKIIYDIYDNYTIIKFNIDKYQEYPFVFWNLIFMKIFNDYGYKCPSKKGIQIFLDKIKSENKFNFILSQNCKCLFNNKIVSIRFNLNHS
jgi:tRNA(Ile)-lysidine synthetase-like protein